MVCVNLVLPRILSMKSRCFLGKITQLAKILHNHRSWWSRQISGLSSTPWICSFYHLQKLCSLLCLGPWCFGQRKYTPTNSASIFIQILQCQYIRKHGRHFSGTTRQRGDLRLEPRILNHLRVGDADHGEPGLGALHLEPPSVEVFDKVAVAECCPIPGAILSRPCVSPKQCVPLSYLG